MSDPTRGQLERALSQRIQAFYRNQLGHQPSKITCQLFAEELAIIIENSVTPPEHLLAKNGQNQLAEQFRDRLDQTIRPDLISLIEEILNVTVIDLMSDATVETGRTGIIAVLDQIPRVRNPQSIPKRPAPEAAVSEG